MIIKMDIDSINLILSYFINNNYIHDNYYIFRQYCPHKDILLRIESSVFLTFNDKNFENENYILFKNKQYLQIVYLYFRYYINNLLH